MTSPQPPLPDSRSDPRMGSEHPRVNAARNALLWLVVVVLAVASYPWWW
jgi:hypothetical protein